MDKYFSNLRLYNDKMQRLAIFGKKIDTEVMEVFILKCSKKDNFSKKFAHEAYENYLKNGEQAFKHNFPNLHPEIISFGDKELATRPKFTFLTWCNNTFYRRMWRIYRHEEEILVNNKKERVISKAFHRRDFFKMDMFH